MVCALVFVVPSLCQGGLRRSSHRTSHATTSTPPSGEAGGREVRPVYKCPGLGARSSRHWWSPGDEAPQNHHGTGRCMYARRVRLCVCMTARCPASRGGLRLAASTPHSAGPSTPLCSCAVAQRLRVRGGGRCVGLLLCFAGRATLTFRLTHSFPYWTTRGSPGRLPKPFNTPSGRQAGANFYILDAQGAALGVGGRGRSPIELCPAPSPSPKIRRPRGTRAAARGATRNHL